MYVHTVFVALLIINWHPLQDINSSYSDISPDISDYIYIENIRSFRKVPNNAVVRPNSLGPAAGQ